MIRIYIDRQKKDGEKGGTKKTYREIKVYLLGILIYKNVCYEAYIPKAERPEW